MIKITNEDLLIQHIQNSAAISQNKNLIKGIGDDAAVFQTPNAQINLIAVDTLVESVHFLKETAPAKLAHKAIAVNVSDIAAMGGTPTFALVSLAISDANSKEYIYELTEELNKAAKKFNVEIVGGDTVHGACLSISVTLLGYAEPTMLCYRNTAKIGDSVYVTGSLGGSFLSEKHLNFSPRLQEAHWLLKNCKLNALMDLSDGLLHDAYRMATASNVTISLEKQKIPLNANCSLSEALNDGEDFELLFTAQTISEEQLKIFQEKFQLTLTKIGEVITFKTDFVLIDDQAQELRSYEHWKF